MAHGMVLIDEARCKGCALCTTACPQGIIEINALSLNDKGYHPARLRDPQGHCTGCAICAVICPDACISVYREARKPMHRVEGQEALRDA